MVRRRQFLDLGAHLGRAGERDEIDPGMAGQCAARAIAAPRHHVDRARRKARLFAELGHAQDAQAGILGRFQHHRIAGGQRRADGAAELLRGIIPGQDMPGNPQRFAKDHDGIAGFIGDDLAMDLVAGAGVIFEIARRRLDVAPRLRDGLAGVAGLQLGQLVLMFKDQPGQARHHPAALGRGDLAPGLFKGLARLAHGQIDVIGGPAGDGPDRRARAWLDHQHRLTAGSGLPVPVDEQVEQMRNVLN